MDNLFNNWFVFGVVGFLVSYFLTYLPYWYNRESKYPGFAFSVFLLLMCLALGKLAFWISIILYIVNVDEFDRWIKNN